MRWSARFAAPRTRLLTFVTKGKVDFQDLANSVLEDITRIALRSAVLGPLANCLGGAVGGIGDGLGGGLGGSLTAAVAHSGGMIGVSALPQRQVPAMAFAGAQRFHGGGFPGLRPGSGVAGLRPDEVPAILQRGERVLSRRELAEGRRITRPVAGTVIVYRDGMEVTSGVSIDHATGLVTFSSAPDAGTEITADSEFNVPARLDTDAADFTVETYEMQQWGRITVVELRE